MNISDYLSSALLNHALGVTAFTAPATVYGGLYVSAPTNVGGGTEVSNADYQRVSTAWSLAGSGVIANSEDVRFPANAQTQSNWGTVTTLGLFDAPTGGHLLFFGPLSANVVMPLGSDFIIPTGSLVITLA